MAKAITEVAVGAAAIGLAIAMPGIGAGLAWMKLGMQNGKHGFGLMTDPGQGDKWLLEDKGERIFHEVNLPCTDYTATAQRLEKIGLMRLRYQGR